MLIFRAQPDDSYSWHEITDADVLKSLEAAKRAQDTADGKRRMFVREQPVPPYDKGDQWSNATFEDKYNNDFACLVSVRKRLVSLSILKIGNQLSIILQSSLKQSLMLVVNQSLLS